MTSNMMRTSSDLISDMVMALRLIIHSSPQGTHYGHGNIKVRIDPPQGQTTTNHLHVEYGTRKNIINYDKNLMRVDRKSPDAHIPIK